LTDHNFELFINNPGLNINNFTEIKEKCILSSNNTELESLKINKTTEIDKTLKTNNNIC
jgi:hypothetical protein